VELIVRISRKKVLLQILLYTNLKRISKMTINIKGELIEFDKIELIIQERNIENVFKDNKRTLKYKLDKAINDPKNHLHKIAVEQKNKYKDYLNLNFGDFLMKLKNTGNEDYKAYLNKYGDKKYCIFKIQKHQREKGIYCFIIEDKIVYIGRSRKTFKERINDYGKITAYNCLKNGQSTNCNINSKINELNQVFIGFHLMTKSTNEEIIKLENQIIKYLIKETELWNIQKN
jgi:hypothetical protein